MGFRSAIACAAIVLGCASVSSAEALSLQFNHGRVTLVAQNVPLRTILAEWGRIGGTRIVNAERIAAPPVTLELNDVTERQALETLLRSAAGYVIVSRNTSERGASSIGGIVILANSSAPRVQPPAAFGNPGVQQGPQGPIVLSNDIDDGDQPNSRRTPPPFPLNPRTPAQPAPTTPQRPTTTVTTLPGTSRPGEVTPPAPPRNQP